MTLIYVDRLSLILILYQSNSINIQYMHVYDIKEISFYFYQIILYYDMLYIFSKAYVHLQILIRIYYCTYIYLYIYSIRAI